MLLSCLHWKWKCKYLVRHHLNLCVSVRTCIYALPSVFASYLVQITSKMQHERLRVIFSWTLDSNLLHHCFVLF